MIVVIMTLIPRDLTLNSILNSIRVKQCSSRVYTVGVKKTSTKIVLRTVFNPRHVCSAARVTVVVPCVCVCLFVVLCHHAHLDPEI